MKREGDREEGGMGAGGREVAKWRVFGKESKGKNKRWGGKEGGMALQKRVFESACCVATWTSHLAERSPCSGMHTNALEAASPAIEGFLHEVGIH